MTCQEFAGIVRDYARGEWIDEKVCELAGRHAAGCEECRRRVEWQRVLDRGFSELRSEAAEPPAPVESAVRAAFRANTSRRKRRERRFWVAAASIAAAVILAVFVLTSQKETEPSQAAVERVTEFLPLRYGKPVEAGEMLQVIRMDVPKGELQRLGLLVVPEGTASTVRADVVLGEDGLAKAIRFVY